MRILYLQWTKQYIQQTKDLSSISDPIWSTFSLQYKFKNLQEINEINEIKISKLMKLKIHKRFYKIFI